MTDTMRRWTDKALVGATGLVVALTATVWAITSGTVSKVDETQRGHGERIKFIEAQQGETQRRLEKIDQKQDKLDEKMDRILDKVSR